jgi:copper chaperone
VDADAKVDIDLAQRKVRVQTDAELAEISAAIVNAGYPVVSSAAV